MSKKNALDQYYTNPNIAAECSCKLKQFIPKHQRQIIIEPSAGNGAFLGHSENTKAYDIYPQHNDIIEQDFISTQQSDFKYDKSDITISGNPPFGHASSLAIRFFNHSVLLGDTIAFIIPKTFR